MVIGNVLVVAWLVLFRSFFLLLSSVMRRREYYYCIGCRPNNVWDIFGGNGATHMLVEGCEGFTDALVTLFRLCMT